MYLTRLNRHWRIAAVPGILLVTAALLTLQSLWIPAKAEVAQWLLERSWAQVRAGADHVAAVLQRAFPMALRRLPAGTTVVLRVTGQRDLTLAAQMGEDGRAKGVGYISSATMPTTSRSSTRCIRPRSPGAPWRRRGSRRPLGSNEFRETLTEDRATIR